MTKTLFSALTVALLLGAGSAYAQTTPPTPTGNRTAGTTTNPVDPTSNTGSKVSGTTGTTTGGTMTTDTPPSTNTAPSGATTTQTPTGNRTAGTTAYPVDPTSKKSPNPTYRSGSKKANKKSAKSGM